MAVKLKKLYAKLYSKYGVRLCTKSCFEKSISWTHILEEVEFVSVLRGGELILNSGYESEEQLKKYIELLDMANAGGLIIALRIGQTFSQEIIDYCNSIEFPLFSATWKTSFMDIMHLVSSILLQNEHKEANQITALKNAIHNPGSPELYQGYFEEREFSENLNYFIVVLGMPFYNAEDIGERLEKLKKSLHYAVSGGVVYEENGILTVLAVGYRKKEIEQWIWEICEKDHNIYGGVGVLVHHICEVHRSYETAVIAYHLAKARARNFLDYDDMGIYKLLSDVRNTAVYSSFAEEILGPLFKYDEDNETEYVQILKTYFEKECNAKQTGEALYFHKNTMTSKLNKIKEILGYDILENENRVKIMMAFYIIRMGKDCFADIACLWEEGGGQNTYFK